MTEPYTLPNCLRIHPDGSHGFVSFASTFREYLPEHMFWDAPEGSALSDFNKVVPQSVIDIALYQAENLGEAISIQVTDMGTHSEFVLLNDQGNEISLNMNLNDFGSVIDGRFNAQQMALQFRNLPGTANADLETYADPSAPVLTNPINEKISLRPNTQHDRTPLINIDSLGFDLKRTFISENEPVIEHPLSIELSGEHSPEVEKLQRMLSRYGEMCDAKIDLGNTGIRLTNESGEEFITNDGIDGYFGPLTQKAVMQVQKDLGLEVTGIADQDFINKLDDKLIELQKAPYAGQRVDFEIDGRIESQDSALQGPRATSLRPE